VRPYDLAPADAFRLVQGVEAAVRVDRASGRKCARSWKFSPDVGSDPDYPDVTPRDAAALREFDAAREAGDSASPERSSSFAEAR
jgi:isoleucyl-tRNA synthetase